jgi:hypothetical protein
MTASAPPKPSRGARYTKPTPAPPATMTIDAIVASHRQAWLRDAAATLTVLDWRAFTDGRTMHVIDARDTGAPAEGYAGFAAGCQLHEVAGHLLPNSQTTRPAAAVAVNVDALVRCLRLSSTSVADEGAAIGTIRAAVAAVAAHELAHVIEAQATGRRLPAGATLATVVGDLANGKTYAPSHQTRVHGPEWTRAYAHLLTRASRLPHYDQWVEWFVRSVRAVLPHQPAAYIDALEPELTSFTADDLLVDIIRSPAPAGFMDLFNTRDAALSAKEEA